MPFIKGFKEQNAALTRIKNNLSTIKKINENIVFLSEFASSPSDAAPKKEINLNCKYFFTDGNDKKFKIPMELDNAFVLQTLHKYKDKIVKEIRDDAQKHQISLEPKEEALLISENESGS